MNQITWTGLSEFTTWLAELPQRLIDGAKVDATQAAQAARDEIYAAYPFKSSGLRDRLYAGQPRQNGQYRMSVTVSNPSPLAHLIERGTEVRHSKFGNRGRMPPQHIFVPRLLRWRQRFYEAEKARLAAEGFTVSGDF